MRQTLDMQELVARYDVVRRSEYFPAILGAVAGGLTGALMAGLISGARRGGEDSNVRAPAREQTSLLLGFSPRDIVQLVTLVASLARQLRDWREK